MHDAPRKACSSAYDYSNESENFSNNSDNWIGNSSAFHDDSQLTPNAGAQLLPKAGATKERTL